MTRSIVIVALLITRAGVGYPDQHAAVRRLAPSVFPNLPRQVRTTLEQRRCTIPQAFEMKTRGNAVAGAFTGPRRQEWAVLCSILDTTQILVIDGQSGRVLDSLERSADRTWIQDIGNGRLGYSRRLMSLPRNRIPRWRADVERRPIPQPIDHDALQQSFVDKFSEAFYFAAGRWHKQITAD